MKNKIYKPYSQSIPNLNSPNPKYFSPLPKSNNENINYQNLNLNQNYTNEKSPILIGKSNINNNSTKNKKTLILDLDETKPRWWSWPMAAS